MKVFVDITLKLEGFSLIVKFQKEVDKLALLGVSGAGKSLLLQCIAGIITPDQGKIMIDDEILFDSSQRINIPARERRIGYLFQDYALFPHLNVWKNIMMVSKDQEKTKELIRLFRLEGLEKHATTQLSGGQKQRVALARMMAANPRLILLDEPFSSVDRILKSEMIGDFLELLKSTSLPFILVTHDYAEALKMAKDCMILHQGELIEEGNIKEILKNPKQEVTRKLFGIESDSYVLVSKKDLIVDGDVVKIDLDKIDL